MPADISLNVQHVRKSWMYNLQLGCFVSSHIAAQNLYYIVWLNSQPKYSVAAFSCIIKGLKEKVFYYVFGTAPNIFQAPVCHRCLYLAVVLLPDPIINQTRHKTPWEIFVCNRNFEVHFCFVYRSVFKFL